jgi:hypothetical protein
MLRREKRLGLLLRGIVAGDVDRILTRWKDNRIQIFKRQFLVWDAEKGCSVDVHCNCRDTSLVFFNRFPCSFLAYNYALTVPSSLFSMAIQPLTFH